MALFISCSCWKRDLPVTQTRSKHQPGCIEDSSLGPKNGEGAKDRLRQTKARQAQAKAEESCWRFAGFCRRRDSDRQWPSAAASSCMWPIAFALGQIQPQELQPAPGLNCMQLPKNTASLAPLDYCCPYLSVPCLIRLSILSKIILQGTKRKLDRQSYASRGLSHEATIFLRFELSSPCKLKTEIWKLKIENWTGLGIRSARKEAAFLSFVSFPLLQCIPCCSTPAICTPAKVAKQLCALLLPVHQLEFHSQDYIIPPPPRAFTPVPLLTTAVSNSRIGGSPARPPYQIRMLEHSLLSLHKFMFGC